MIIIITQVGNSMKSLILIVLSISAYTQQPINDGPVPQRRTVWSSWNTETKIELSLAGGLLATDGWTTRRNISPQYREMNPLARPFASSDAGEAGYLAIAFSGLIGVQRLPVSPKVKHGLLWAVIATEAYCTVRNARVKR